MVIGSGVAGLTAAALLAHYGRSVTVLEAHSSSGGCLHSWSRPTSSGVCHFDTGASLFSGLDHRPTDNPLAAVLDLLQIRVPTVRIADNHTALHFQEGIVRTRIGGAGFAAALGDTLGRPAERDWHDLTQICAELGTDATAVHPLAVRYDGAIAYTAGLRRPYKLWTALASQRRLGDRSFGSLARSTCSSPAFLLWLDRLCRATAGSNMDTVTASYMVRAFTELYSEEAVHEYPIGGPQALADALVAGVTARGGEVRLGARVVEILREGGKNRKGKACGVMLADGTAVKARVAVISNATVWDTLALCPGLDVVGSESSSSSSSEVAAAAPITSASATYVESTKKLKKHDSWLHLHTAFRRSTLPQSPNPIPFHSFFFREDLLGDADAWPTVCVPTVVDPGSNPPDVHCMHAYYAEPYAPWEEVAGAGKRAVYRARKEEKAAKAWRLAELAVPGCGEDPLCVHIGYESYQNFIYMPLRTIDLEIDLFVNLSFPFSL